MVNFIKKKKKNAGKSLNTWKLNNIFLKNSLVKKEVSKGNLKYT